MELFLWQVQNFKVLELTSSVCQIFQWNEHFQSKTKNQSISDGFSFRARAGLAHWSKSLGVCHRLKNPLMFSGERKELLSKKIYFWWSLSNTATLILVILHYCRRLNNVRGYQQRYAVSCVERTTAVKYIKFILVLRLEFISELQIRAWQINSFSFKIARILAKPLGYNSEIWCFV